MYRRKVAVHIERRGRLPKGYFGYGKAAALLDISVSTLQRWVSLENIPYDRLKGRVCFTRQMLEEWIESCKRGGDNGTTGA